MILEYLDLLEQSVQTTIPLSNKIFTYDTQGNLIVISVDDVATDIGVPSNTSRITNLEGNLGTLQTDLSALDTQITQLNDVDLVALQASLDQLNLTDLPALQTSLADLNNVDLPALDSALNTLNNTTIPQLQIDLATNNSAISTLNTVTIPNLQTALSVNESAIATLNDVKLPELDAELASAQSNIDTLNNTDLPNLQAQLDANDGELNTLNTVTLPGLQTEIDNNESAISTLNTVTIPGLNTSLATNASAISTLNTVSLPALQTEIDANETAITTLNDTSLPNLQTQITANDGDLNTLNTVTIPGLNTSIASNLSLIDTLNNTTIPGLQTQITANDGDINTLNTVTIPGLNTSLATNTTAIGTLNTVSLPALQTEIDANESAIGTLNTVSLPALQAEIDANESAIGTLNTTTIPGLQTQLDSNDAELNTLAVTTIPGLQSDISANASSLNTLSATTIPGLQGQIDANDGELNTLNTTTLPGLQTDIDSKLSDSNNVINLNHFAAGLAPIEQVATLPAFGNAGRVVLLTTDNKLYRDTGTAWTSEVDATDVAGQITGTQITDDAISTPKIAAGAIVTSKIAAGAITADEIASGSIVTAKLAANAVTANEIATNAVTANAIAAGAVTASEIAANAITAAEIATGTITASEIATGTITASEIAANAVTASEIAAGAITTAKIAAGAITANEIATNAVTANAIAANAVTASEIAAGTITASEIATGTITSAKINVGDLVGSTAFFDQFTVATGFLDTLFAADAFIDRITANEIATNAVTADAIAANAVTANEIAAGAVTASEIAAGTITASEIAAGTITAAKIATGTITATEIAAGAITATEIAANTITASEIATNAVTANEIAAGAVTASEIAANAVTANAIAADAVTANEIDVANLVASVAFFNEFTALNGFIDTLFVEDAFADKITANEIAANAVTANAIAADAVTANEIAAGAVTANEIAAGAVTANEIAANAVTANAIAAGAVTASEIAADTITANEIATDAVTANEIDVANLVASVAFFDEFTAVSGFLDTLFAADAFIDRITANEIATNAVTANAIAANAVTANEIAAGTITASEIATGAITANEIATNAITANEILAGAITTAKIAADAITANEIATGAITADAISANAITANAIATGAITATKIATDAVTANSIATNAVTADAIAANAVTANEISVGTLAAIAADLGTITAGLLQNTSGNFAIDASNSLISISDTQTTPVERIKLGKLGVGTTDWGLEIYDSSGGLILGANGLGTNVVVPDNIDISDLEALGATLGNWTISADEIKSVDTDGGLVFNSNTKSIKLFSDNGATSPVVIQHNAVQPTDPVSLVTEKTITSYSVQASQTVNVYRPSVAPYPAIENQGVAVEITGYVQGVGSPTNAIDAVEVELQLLTNPGNIWVAVQKVTLEVLQGEETYFALMGNSTGYDAARIRTVSISGESYQVGDIKINEYNSKTTISNAGITVKATPNQQLRYGLGYNTLGSGGATSNGNIGSDTFLEVTNSPFTGVDSDYEFVGTIDFNDAVEMDSTLKVIGLFTANGGIQLPNYQYLNFNPTVGEEVSIRANNNDMELRSDRQFLFYESDGETLVFDIDANTGGHTGIGGAHSDSWMLKVRGNAQIDSDLHVSDGIAVYRSGSPTIAGTNFSDGWLRLGTSGKGIAIDDNEIVQFGDNLNLNVANNTQLVQIGGRTKKISFGGDWVDNSATTVDHYQFGDYTQGEGIIIKSGATSDGAITFSNTLTSVNARILWKKSENTLKLFAGSDAGQGIHLLSGFVNAKDRLQAQAGLTVTGGEIGINQTQDHLRFREADGTEQWYLMTKPSSDYRVGFYDRVNTEFILTFGATSREWDFSKTVNFNSNITVDGTHTITGDGQGTGINFTGGAEDIQVYRTGNNLAFNINNSGQVEMLIIEDEVQIGAPTLDINSNTLTMGSTGASHTAKFYSNSTGAVIIQRSLTNSPSLRFRNDTSGTIAEIFGQNAGGFLFRSNNVATGDIKFTPDSRIMLGKDFTNEAVGSIQIAKDGADGGLVLWNESGAITKRIWSDATANRMYITAGSNSTDGAYMDLDGNFTFQKDVAINAGSDPSNLTITNATEASNLRLQAGNDWLIQAEAGNNLSFYNETASRSWMLFNEVSNRIEMGNNVRNSYRTEMGSWQGYGGLISSNEGTLRQWRIANNGVNGGTWYKVADVTVNTGTYNAYSFWITYYDSQSNYGGSGEPDVREYQVTFRRSGGVQDNLDDAIIVGYSADRLRVVKTATGVYELQTSHPTNYRGWHLDIRTLGSDGGSIVMDVTGSTVGTSVGTIYTANTDGDVERFFGGKIRANNFYSAGTSVFNGIVDFNTHLDLSTSSVIRLIGNETDTYIDLDDDTAFLGGSTNAVTMSSVADLVLRADANNNGTGEIRFANYTTELARIDDVDFDILVDTNITGALTVTGNNVRIHGDGANAAGTSLGQLEWYNDDNSSGGNSVSAYIDVRSASNSSSGAGGNVFIGAKNAGGTLTDVAKFAQTQANFYTAADFASTVTITGTLDVSGRTNLNGGLNIIHNGDTDTVNITAYSPTGRAQITLNDSTSADIWRFGKTGGASNNFAFYNGTDDILTLTSAGADIIGAATISSTLGVTGLASLDGGISTPKGAIFTGKGSANGIQFTGGSTDYGIHEQSNKLYITAFSSGQAEIVVEPDAVTIDGVLYLNDNGDTDGQMIVMQDADSDYTARIQVNDGQGNFAITSNLDGTGTPVTLLDGIVKTLYSGNAENDGGWSANAGLIGASTFNIGILVDSATRTLRVGSSGNDIGLDSSEGYEIADYLGNLTAQEQLNFKGATENQFIAYATSEGGGQVRRALTMDGVTDTVALSNRAPNGAVQIRANTATAGTAGEKTIAQFEDDRVYFYEKIHVADSIALSNTTGESSLSYWVAGDTLRDFMRIDHDAGLVKLNNRASNGVVQIAANTATAGVGGEVVVAQFQDTEVRFYAPTYVEGNLVVGTGSFDPVINFRPSDDSASPSITHTLGTGLIYNTKNNESHQFWNGSSQLIADFGESLVSINNDAQFNGSGVQGRFYRNDTIVDSTTVSNIVAENDSTGDASIDLLLTNDQRWRMMVDNSDANAYKIVPAATSVYSMRISPADEVTFSNTVRVGSAGTNVANTWNSVKLHVSGSILLDNNALIYSAQADNNNVDHIWHDDASHVATGTGGTYHFISDGTYKANGNSTLEAGALWMTRTGNNNYIGGRLGIGESNPSSHQLKVGGTSAFSGTIGSYSYSSGILGSGWIIDPNATGGSFAELDNLRVRNELRAHVFKKDVVKVANGYLYLSDAAEIAETVTISTTADTFKVKDVGSASFSQGQLLWAKNIQDDGSLQVTGVKITVGTVASTGSTNGVAWTEYNIDAVENGGTLNGGDTIVRVSDASILFDASSQYAPFMDVYDDVQSWSDFNSPDNTKVRIGNLSGKRSIIYGELAGHGGWTNNFYLEGNAQVAGTLTAGDISGIGQTFVAGKLKVNLLPRSANALNNNSHSSAASNPSALYNINPPTHLGQRSPNVMRVRTGTSQGSSARFGLGGAGLRTTELPALDVDYIYSFYVYVPTRYAGTTGNSAYAKQHTSSSNWQGTDIENQSAEKLIDFSIRDEWQRCWIKFKPTQALANSGSTYLHVMMQFGGSNVANPDDTDEIFVTAGQLEQVDSDVNVPSLYQENYDAANPTSSPSFADPYTADQYDGAYGMWATFGGFGGNRYNPTIELGDYGFQIKNADNLSSSALADNSIMVGNITGSANSGIKITNTGVNNTSGVFGYTGAGVESFALRLDGTAHVSGWNIDGAKLSGGNLELLSSGQIWHTGNDWSLNNDGSGRLASGNITWDATGNVTLDPSVVIAYSSVSGTPTTLDEIESSAATKLDGIAAGAQVNTINAGDGLNALDAAANTKLGGIAEGATVGATWGSNISGQPTDFVFTDNIGAIALLDEIDITDLNSTVIDQGKIVTGIIDANAVIAEVASFSHSLAVGTTNPIALDGVNSVISTAKWSLNGDGSGLLADDNINWNAAGDFNLGSSTNGIRYTASNGKLLMGEDVEIEFARPRSDVRVYVAGAQSSDESNLGIAKNAQLANTFGYTRRYFSTDGSQATVEAYNPDVVIYDRRNWTANYSKESTPYKLFEKGYAVITIGNDTSGSHWMITGVTSISGTSNWGGTLSTELNVDHPLNVGPASWTASTSDGGQKITGYVSEAEPIAFHTNDPTRPMILVAENAAGGIFIHIQEAYINNVNPTLVQAILDYAAGVKVYSNSWRKTRNTATYITKDAIVSPTIAGVEGSFSGYLSVGSNIKMGIGVDTGKDGIKNAGDFWYDDGTFQFGGTSGITYNGTTVTLGSDIVLDPAVTISYGSVTGLNSLSQINATEADQLGRALLDDIGLTDLNSTVIDNNQIITGLINANAVIAEVASFSHSMAVGTTNPIALDGVNSVISTTGWSLDGDGSGSLANGNISWTSTGALTFSGWTANDKALWRSFTVNSETTHLILGDPDTGAPGPDWVSSIIGLQVGKAPSDRILFGVHESQEDYYTFRVISGGSTLVKLGTKNGGTADNEIAGWKITTNTFTGGNLELVKGGQIRHTGDLWRLNNDGSGQLAAGKISWDDLGAVTLDPSVTISYGSVTGVPTTLDEIESAAATKLDGIEAGAQSNPSYIESTKITSTTIEAPTIAGNTGSFSGHVSIGSNIKLGVDVSGSNDGILVGSDYWYDNGNFQLGGGTGIVYNGSNVTIGSAVTINASLSANNLTTGTIDASDITVSNIDAANISTGLINSDRINVSDLSVLGTDLSGWTMGINSLSHSGGIVLGTVVGADDPYHLGKYGLKIDSNNYWQRAVGYGGASDWTEWRIGSATQYLNFDGTDLTTVLQSISLDATTLYMNSASNGVIALAADASAMTNTSTSGIWMNGQGRWNFAKDANNYFRYDGTNWGMAAENFTLKTGNVRIESGNAAPTTDYTPTDVTSNWGTNLDITSDTGWDFDTSSQGDPTYTSGGQYITMDVTNSSSSNYSYMTQANWTDITAYRGKTITAKFDVRSIYMNELGSGSTTANEPYIELKIWVRYSDNSTKWAVVRRVYASELTTDYFGYAPKELTFKVRDDWDDVKFRIEMPQQLLPSQWDYAGAPSTHFLRVYGIEVKEWDDSRVTINDDGLTVFKSPIDSLEANTTSTEMKAGKLKVEQLQIPAFSSTDEMDTPEEGYVTLAYVFGGLKVKDSRGEVTSL